MIYARAWVFSRQKFSWTCSSSAGVAGSSHQDVSKYGCGASFPAGTCSCGHCVLLPVGFLGLLFRVTAAWLPVRFDLVAWTVPQKTQKVFLEKAHKGTRVRLIFQGCFGDFRESQPSVLERVSPGRGRMSYLMLITPFLGFAFFGLCSQPIPCETGSSNSRLSGSQTMTDSTLYASPFINISPLGNNFQ